MRKPQKSERKKSAQQSAAKSRRRDAKIEPARPDEQVRVRRKLCSALRFWMVCGHKPCSRTRACALASNDCFERFWPLVPEQTKICIRAGMEAGAGGGSRADIAAAITRALARWRETQALPVASGSTPQPAEVAPASRIAAPMRATPRARVL